MRTSSPADMSLSHACCPGQQGWLDEDKISHYVVYSDNQMSNFQFPTGNIDDMKINVDKFGTIKQVSHDGERLNSNHCTVLLGAPPTLLSGEKLLSIVKFFWNYGWADCRKITKLE